MIPMEDLATLIKGGFPDAEIDITDKTGMRDHYSIRVISRHFDGVNMLDRHRMVMAQLQPAMQDGRLHAAEIQTGVPN
ncbi:MAG TPA: BolA/IbaG family iron-sulfur metabolism protein [Coleofasciculaceae cyanobacterium]|jgi:stress-induced morphogen